ncbi:hypothetical protein LOK49_LG06G00843 [Camellia lanceoleosa]|uniref:Uncharacterized protein n=1 Tax=Camellia lanceoleosa TaxID=1840588 RepID=A0ACC0H8I4_9ERIC|nr:hypothetical protein LOK49_LG06G00843 [Camellia lanceoleosa]
MQSSTRRKYGVISGKVTKIEWKMKRAMKANDAEEEDEDGLPNCDNVYVKDDFFDSLSCLTLDGGLGRGRGRGRAKFSEQKKIDIETFGEVPRHQRGHPEALIVEEDITMLGGAVGSRVTCFYYAWVYDGVLNIVHGTNDIVNAICDDDDIRAISFVGSNTGAIA